MLPKEADCGVENEKRGRTAVKNAQFIFAPALGRLTRKGGRIMHKEDEKKQVNWEISDPKPPVIRSGHMENRKEN